MMPIPIFYRYLFLYFLRTIFIVFTTVYVLIYLVDLVEIIRRCADVPGATVFTSVWLSFLRTPSIAEQVFPFAVLGGAMIVFVTLTKRFELIVIRAAGVSIWQILIPPVVAAFLLGAVLVFGYNPLSSQMKMQADQIEAGLFKNNKLLAAQKGTWLRQKSLDGQSIFHAIQASQDGSTLTGVTAFVYDSKGHFVERVEAASAQLFPSYWRMDDARVQTLDDPIQPVETYLLATNLTKDQLTKTLLLPGNVPFWSLKSAMKQIEAAGLDSAPYRLHYQSLLARPLLFVAMILIAACFSLRFVRLGGVSLMLSSGILVGFALYVVTKLIGDLGNAGFLSPFVAAWSPPVLSSLLGVLALLYQEDG